MFLLNKQYLFLTLFIFGYFIYSSAAFSLRLRRDSTKAELQKKCEEGDDNPCKDFCKQQRLISLERLPSIINKVIPRSVYDIRGACDGQCFDGKFCGCEIDTPELKKRLQDITIMGISAFETLFTSSVVIGGESVTLASITCEDPK